LQQLAKAFHASRVSEIPDVPAVPAEELDHALVPVVSGSLEGRAVVNRLPRIDFRAAIDQKARDAQGVGARSHMQRALPAFVLDLDRHAEIQQEFHNVHAINLRSRK